MVVFGVFISGEGVHVFSFSLVPLPCSIESERSQCSIFFYLVLLYKEGRTKYMVSNIVGKKIPSGDGDGVLELLRSAHGSNLFYTSSKKCNKK